ncbi:AAA domain-containing protein [Gordonia sp. HNM0687]|uniref:AAA domain-containing protein n=1 Tax=Gordonia mangrovi TaxID=2665643 RepID=A0A6L7GS46_9ACTN|nr:AAA family ATPase [Gordonia mangrovi]MXP21951.1 AAA domain-containing protein [Gordonia mangrovi]UVF76312.1 AAA family ATPase [Gordonia mangrovi]
MSTAVPLVPPWPKFARPVLDVLSDGNVWKTADLKQAVMTRQELTQEQLAETLNSGQGKADNRIGWALSFVTRAQAVEKIKNGQSRITDFGRQMLRDHPVEITEADLKAIPAYQEYKPKKRSSTPVGLDVEALPSHWFVGAFFADLEGYVGPIGDQTEQFVREGRWFNGNEGKYLDHVRSMKSGERIAIKAAFTRMHDLPFETKGHRVSVMAIKAVGTIRYNHGDGYNIDVDWEPLDSVREWYFYTNQQTVWQVKPADWKSKALIAFAFDGEDQDYDEFRNTGAWAERFGDDAPVVLDEGDDETLEEELPSTPTYGIADIIADGCFIPSSTLAGYLEALDRKKNLILQGPPGTGKTWLAKRLGRALIGRGASDVLRSVQFHPTMSYEDFVRGWRPSGDGRLTLKDGLFLEIINDALATPGRKHVLVIEEINRGNLAQIFGELLTLLEADKRVATEALTLTYRKPNEDPVFIPENLYIIGTMNLADRSLAIVDFALRRRFAFADLSPQFNDAWRNWVSSRNRVDATVLADLATRIDALNTQIAEYRSLGAQYCIGHSFFTPANDTRIDDPSSWIRGVVDQEIRPLLAEYWFDDPARVETETAKLIGTP